jgi:hypothetical protein
VYAKERFAMKVVNISKIFMNYEKKVVYMFFGNLLTNNLILNSFVT